MRLRNSLYLFCCMTGVLVWSVACGGKGSGGGGEQPSAEDSTVTADAVFYNNMAELETSVTVTVIGDQGSPMAGVMVILGTSRPNEDTIVEELGVTTDASGEAVFTVTSDTLGQSEFTAELPDEMLTLVDTVTVDFTLQAEIVFGAIKLVPPGATVDATVTLSDGLGPVEGAEVMVVSDRMEDTIDPDQVRTDENGNGAVSIDTLLAGTANLSLTFVTLNGSLPLDSITFEGPTISGDVTFNQTFGTLTAPRVGVVYLDVENFDTGFGNPDELVSAPLSVTMGGTESYQLTLPMTVPSAHLFRPGDDPTLPADFEMAPYAVVVYDDIGNDDGVMDASDLLVGVNHEIPWITFLSGTMPQDASGFEPGYIMLQMIFEGEGDPYPVSWEDNADQMDVDITMAFVSQADVTGDATFGNALADNTEIMVAAVMVDPTSFAGNPWDPANHDVVASDTMTYTRGGSGSYTLSFPDLTQHAHFDDWSISMGGGPAMNFIIMLAFVDLDQNGSPNPMSEPIFMLDQPFGIDGIFVWHVHTGLDWLFSFLYPVFHPGYVLVRTPLERNITAINVNNGTLTLDDDIERGHTMIDFRIQREVAGEDVTILESNDLDTNTAQPDTARTNADLSTAQVGDKLVITEVIDQMEVLDFNYSVNYQIP